MKKLVLLTGLLFTFFTVIQAQDNQYLTKVETLDSTIETLYSVISGEKGQERDWELFRFLFHPEAKLIPTGKGKQGNVGTRFMTPNDYIDNSGQWLVENGFFEKEIYRVENRFGSISHVFSTYASFHSEADKEPFMRGINSIQLLNDGSRWWIINIYWTAETEENPIPKIYLPK